MNLTKQLGAIIWRRAVSLRGSLLLSIRTGSSGNTDPYPGDLRTGVSAPALLDHIDTWRVYLAMRCPQLMGFTLDTGRQAGSSWLLESLQSELSLKRLPAGLTHGIADFRRNLIEMLAGILKVPSFQIWLGWCDEHRHEDEADEAEDDERQKIPHQLTP